MSTYHIFFTSNLPMKISAFYKVWTIFRSWKSKTFATVAKPVDPALRLHKCPDLIILYFVFSYNVNSDKSDFLYIVYIGMSHRVFLKTI